MSTPYYQLILTNLEGGGDFTFRLFPTSIETNARANWQAQDTTIGVKPLFYANREPRRLVFSNLLLDGENESIALEISELLALMEEDVGTPAKPGGTGRPPALLAQWGGRQERCVLEDATVVEEMFLTDGTPTRARVSLTLLQFQDDAPPATRRRVRENEEANILF